MPCVSHSPIRRSRLTALVTDRNTPQKHVSRTGIVLLSIEGVGTLGITGPAGTSNI